MDEEDERGRRFTYLLIGAALGALLVNLFKAANAVLTGRAP